MMTRLILATISLLCFGTSTLFSRPANIFLTSEWIQEHTVHGRVLSSDANEPIPAATIRINSVEQIATTDEKGYFYFTVSSELKNITIRITHIGYRPATRTIDLNHDLNELIFILHPDRKILSPVTVLSHRMMRSPTLNVDTENNPFLPIDSGAFLRDAGNASGIRRGGFGIDPVLRGLSGSRLNVRVDGMTTTAAACPNRMDPPTSHIRLTDIERIEIHRGPHALQYGPSFGGTVNFVTQKPELSSKTTLSGDLRAGLESNTGHRKTDLRLQTGNTNWEFLVNGGISSTDNYESGNDIRIPAGFESVDYGADLGVNLTDDHRISAGWSQSFVRNADFPSLGMDMAMDDTYKLKTAYVWNPSDKNHLQELSVNGYWSLVDHEMNNHERDSFNMMDAIALAETNTFGVHIKSNGLLNSGTWSIVAGLDQQNVTGTRFVDFKMGPRTGESITYNLWQDAAITNAGLFAGIEHFIGNWTLSLGTRIDVNIADSKDPAPRFEVKTVKSDHLNLSLSGGITKPLSQNVSAGLFIGRGVRSPDITERYINFLTIGRDGYEYAGNPDLKPEANNQVDFVFQSRFERIRFDMTLFGSYMTNYISAVFDPETIPVGMGSPGVRFFQNRGDAFFTGYESELSVEWIPGWFTALRSSYTRATYRDENKPVAEIPPLEAAMTLGGSAFSGNLSQELTIRRVFPQSRFDESFGENRTPGFVLVDLNLSTFIMEGIQLSGGVRNLFNEAYYEHLNRRFNPGIDTSSGYLLEPGRRFFLELSVRI